MKRIIRIIVYTLGALVMLPIAALALTGIFIGKTLDWAFDA